MARQITLDDKEYIEIVNSKKEVTGGFWWNPSDLDIVKRCDKVMEFFEHMEVPEGKDDADIMFKISDIIKNQFNYLISPGAADELFKNCNPLSPRDDGTLYCEYVLNVIVAFIESQLNVRMKRTTSRIKKYTDKYEK